VYHLIAGSAVSTWKIYQRRIEVADMLRKLERKKPQNKTPEEQRAEAELREKMEKELSFKGEPKCLLAQLNFLRQMTGTPLALLNRRETLDNLVQCHPRYYPLQTPATQAPGKKPDGCYCEGIRFFGGIQCTDCTLKQFPPYVGRATHKSKLRQVADLTEYASKASRAADIAVETFGKKKKCVIFTQYLGVADVIQACIEKKCGIQRPEIQGPVLRLDGIIKVDDRDQVISDFLSCDKPCALVCLPQVAGEGLNLIPKSPRDLPIDTVILCDPWWNDARDRQSMARCCRIGQKSDYVHVHRLFSRNTIDEAMEEVQKVKRDATKHIVTDLDHYGFHTLIKSGYVKKLMEEIEKRMLIEEACF